MINYFVKHKLAANIFMVAVLVVGLISALNMPTKLMPDIQFPFASFDVEWEGATADIIVSDISKDLGNEIKQVSGVKTVYSTSRDGSLWMGAVFDLNAEMETVKKDVQDVIDNFDWPSEVDLPSLTQAKMVEPVGMVVISMPGDVNNLRSVVDTALDELGDLGLPDISVTGFPDTDIQWKPTLDTWLALQATPATVAAELQSNTSRQGLGSVGKQSLEMGEFTTRTAQLNELIYVNTPIFKIHQINDLASERGTFFYGDQPAIVLEVSRPADMGTLQAGEIIEKWQQEFTKDLPSSLEVYPFLFPVELFEGHVSLLLDNAYLGLVLVLITLFVLLNGRVAFWTAAGIPVALIGAFGLIYFFDGTLSMFSIFALLIALGIVVDDAIVVSEQTLTLHDGGLPPEEAASKAARGMVTPITAASLTTIAAFAPLLFLPGSFGELVKPIPLVMICVLAASLFECFFILPNHLNHSLSRSKNKKPTKFRLKVDKSFNHVRDVYFRRFISWVVTHRVITISTAFGILIISLSLVIGSHVKINPDLAIEANQVEMTISFYPDTTDEEQLAVSVDATQAIESLDAEYSPLLIKHLSEQRTRGNRLKIYAVLYDQNTRPLNNQEVAKMWVERVSANSAIDTIVTSEDADTAGRGGINAKQIGFRVQGENNDDLMLAMDEMRNEMSKLPHLDGLTDNVPPLAYRVAIKASVLSQQMGMDDDYLNSQVRSWLNDQSIVKVPRADSMSEFFIGVDEDNARRLDFIESIPVRSPEGVYYSLGQLTDKTYKVTPDYISMENGRISLNIAAQLIDESLESGLVQREVQADIITPIATKYGLLTKESASNEELQEFAAALYVATPVALLLIYLTLAWVFQSWIWPIAVVTAIPFAMTGAIFGHWVMGFDLTIMSALGLFGLAGIVVNDSIILIDRFRQLLEEIEDVKEAVIEAAVQRFRAVLLTTITTMVGLIPLLFETSVEAQIIKTMAISLVFGLAYGTVVVLVITPSLMTLVRSRKKKLKPEEEKGVASTTEIEAT